VSIRVSALDHSYNVGLIRDLQADTFEGEDGGSNHEGKVLCIEQLDIGHAMLSDCGNFVRTNVDDCEGEAR
jgi:hypothetical protein